MDKNEYIEIDMVNSKERLKITCVERKYRIEKPTSSFIIVAKKEFDEDTTDKLLHEDMELKTFLANYEITNIKFPIKGSSTESVINSENAKLTKRVSLKKNGEMPKSVSVLKRTLERRSLFDSLDLPEEFTSRNYIDALRKNGITISNNKTHYNDLKHFEKKGKITKLGKTYHNAQIYKLVKNDDTNIENKIFV